MEYSEPSSPDFYSGNGYYSDNHQGSTQQQGSFSIGSGPAAVATSYSPQYADPPLASMESIHRTLAQTTPSEHEEFSGFVGHRDIFADSITHNFSHGERAQFPSPDRLVSQFDENQAYTYPSHFTNVYNNSQPAIELRTSEHLSNHTPTPYNSYPNSGADSDLAISMPPFPSQLLAGQCDGLPFPERQDTICESPEESHQMTMAIGLKYGNILESDESSASPPDPSITFKPPPPPMDIASRRKKVQVKPAALVAETLRGRPVVGPRTVSHAEGFRRPSESPASSPMRRIVSAGGNGRNVMGGRVYKSGIESSQRSPINLGGFADAGSFIEHNYHNIRQPPSRGNTLAPPTPMSPREREMSFTKREYSRSTASPVNPNFVFNNGTCFTSTESDQNPASPPETPQGYLAINVPNNPWTHSMDFAEKSWPFEVSDEPLYTPAGETFPLELHMPQPSYLASLSQPVTPAFGSFNPTFMFGGHNSPQFLIDSPQYTLSTQTGSEYSFPQDHFVPGMSPSTTKQKTFQFSHTTAADFSDK